LSSNVRGSSGSGVSHPTHSRKKTGPSNQTLGFASIVALFGYLGLLIFVRANPRSRGDTAATLRLQRNNHPALARLMGWISWFGFRPQSLWLPFILVAFSWIKGLRLGSAFLVFAWASSLLSFFTKLIIKRPRPDDPLIRVVDADIRDTSFPSGHTLHYVTFWGFVAYLAATNLRDRTVRRVVAVVIGAVIGLIGPSRVYLGHHWLTDVLASYLLGFAYFAGLVWAYRWLRSMLDGDPEPQYYEPEVAPLPVPNDRSVAAELTAP
jgi:membrane-associated phospholipid phosphatase